MSRPGRISLVSVLLLGGCASAGSPTPPPAASGAAPAGSSAAAPAASAGCHSPVATGRLPDWADAGFSGDTRMPHVFGDRGEIVAILFGHPLTVSRSEGPTNKILWVGRPASASPDPAASTTLVITATLDGSGTRVTREVAGGPGPSIVDLPAAGCWHLRLAWSGRVDTMDLGYAAGT
ncbi:hypothetical protein O7598_11540 [Micromonospora sp. WMMC241]|uniref:hypothetical protein n=1 Tax=Micromonospora sp. WMMC241 TaxID=3015159 RepID=UPI0022B5F115|nr:hypothetical protein [Micromonospora sp. WMMC241]MCZ7437028.1 hypothetical protein [Micromonospora sp. WMMC241]